METQPLAVPPSPKKLNEGSKASQPPKLIATDVAQFFARMEHLYGHRWSGQYGKPLNEQWELTLSARQWLADLAPFTPAQIRAALEATELEHHDWPPTVPQFKALCRGVAPAPADPRHVALLRANDALQNVLTDAKLGLLEQRAGTYDDATLAALETVGGVPALADASYAQRAELGPGFVRAYLARVALPAAGNA